MSTGVRADAADDSAVTNSLAGGCNSERTYDCTSRRRARPPLAHVASAADARVTDGKFTLRDRNSSSAQQPGPDRGEDFRAAARSVVGRDEVVADAQ